RANLSGANLSGASLKRANLNRAKLSRANLSGANLNGASLRGTKFGNNLGISNKLRREFETRGAKFVDSPEDTAWIESPIRP
ncbi:MAG: pentapeptide repeat-containing protein, partial [Prochloraceae cyanobacterium]